jgi:phenylacetate-CoA ligase
VELARGSVPFYSELAPPSQAPDPEEAIQETLESIPILEKSTYRDNFERMINSRLRVDQIRYSNTSGTTGSALRLAHTSRAIAEEYATVWRMRRACGVGIKDPSLTFAGQLVVAYDQSQPPFWRYSLYNRQTLFSVHHMTPANLDHYADAIHKSNATYVGGYPSSLHLVARALLEAGRPVEKGKFQAVFTSSESLLAFQRKTIEEAFGCRVLDRYGSAEFAVSMTECPSGNLHVDMEYCLVEVEKAEETSEYIRGPLLVTGFGNDATPFLRYRIGDVGTRLKQPCPCGRAGHVFKDVDGRNEDYIVTPDGREVGRLDHIFKSQGRILEAQIVQDTVRALDVFIVPASDYGDADDASLRHEIQLRLGSEIHIDVHRVETIPRERNGKFRAVKSRVGSLLDSERRRNPAMSEGRN